MLRSYFTDMLRLGFFFFIALSSFVHAQNAERPNVPSSLPSILTQATGSEDTTYPVTFSISGDSAEPLEGVLIEITSFQGAAISEKIETDRTGKASVNLKSAEYLVSISKDGFAEESEIVNVKPAPLDLTYRLTQKNVKMLSEVRVDAVQKRAKEKEHEFKGNLDILDSSKIEELSIKNISDITDASTGVINVGSSLGFSIRGISPMRPEPVIGYYIDGVAQTQSGGSPGVLSGVDQIAIYKGTQPTAFGRSFLGGVIDITTKRPRNKTEGHIKVSVGNGLFQNYELAMNTPIIKDTLFFNGNFYFTKKDGFYNNANLDKKAGGFEEVSPGFSIKSYFKNNSSLDVHYGYKRKRDSILPFGLKSNLLAGNRVIEHTFENMGISEDHNVHFNYYVEFRPYDFSLRAVTSYRLFQLDDNADYDFSKSDLLRSKRDTTANTLIEEITFKSISNRNFVWDAGIFLLYNHKTHEESLTKMKDSEQQFGLVPGIDEFNFTAQELNLALRGQIEYTFANIFGLLGGMRYDYYYKSLNLDEQNQDLNKITLSSKRYDRQTGNYNGVSPKAGFFFKYKQMFNYYFNFTLGYRPGGINEIVTGPDEFKYNRELTYNYETGVKLNLFRSLWTFDVSYFAIQWKDIQLYSFKKPRVFELVVQNGGDALSQGVEIGTTAFLHRTLSLEGGFVFTSAKFQSGKIDAVDHISGSKDVVDLKDKNIAFAPKYFVRSALQFAYPIERSSYNFKPYARLEYFYNSGMYFSEKNKYKSPPFNMVNLKFGMISDHVDVIVFLKNILNVTYQTYSLELAGNYFSDRINVNDPFSFGIDIVLKL